jgi:uncharacterized membrane protein
MFAGIISALAILFILFKLDIRKVLYFDIIVDIAVSTLLTVIFLGTFSGMMAAIAGGAIFSVIMFMLKKTMGYKKPTVTKFKIKWKLIK